MKSIVRGLLFCSVLFALCTCSNPKENAKSDSDTTASVSPSTEESPSASESTESSVSKVLLKGIYATSTQIPSSSYGYSSLFDGNKNTYWATMPGAASDEGIMLYFQSPQSISQLEILQPTGKNLSAIKTVSIYVNGSAYKNVVLGSGKVGLEASEVQSLFIRIDQVSNTTKQDIEAITIYDFPSDSFVGISELVLYNNNTPISIALPARVKATMKASSTLQPEISYGIRNLFDSRKEFVWVEGAKNAGQNESLTFNFEEEQEISGLKIMNGFQRSEKHFTANGRVKSLSVFNEKKESGEVSLDDKQGEQVLQLTAPVTGKEITVVVKDIYPGATYKDLVISELEFVNKKGDFIIEDNITEGIKQELLAKAKNTVLEKILDKRVANEYSDMDSYKRSLILRSDYTFVAYSDESTELASGSQTNEIIADGNWEIKELGTDQVKIRIFGKLVRLSESTDYYNGDSSDSYLQIFQDNLTITRDVVKGEKIIQELKLPVNEK